MSVLSALERSLGADGVLVLAGLVLVVALTAIHLLRRGGAGRVADTLATLGLAVAIVGVVVVTLRPNGIGAEPALRRLILDPVLGASDGHGRTVWRPLVENVALFVPVGALAAARFPGRGLRVLLAAVVLSIAIESAQYVLPIGRIANSADVIANAAGAAIGVLGDRVVAALTGTRRAPRRRHGTKATLTMPGSRAANRS